LFQLVLLLLLLLAVYRNLRFFSDFLLLLLITALPFLSIRSNSSGSKEENPTTNKHNRGRSDTSGSGHNSAPTIAQNHDRYKDLTAIVLEPKNRKDPQFHEKIIVKEDINIIEENPTLAELLDLRPR
jgi:hypothetical protein